MTANLLIHRDPFRPTLNTEVSEVNNGRTVFEVLIETDLCEAQENGIKRLVPFYVLLNGQPLLQQDWNTVLSANDFLQVTLLPKGGGGGSNIGAILGAIAMAVMAYFTMGLSLVATAAVGVGAFAVLSLAMGAVPAPSSLGTANREASSPTYSLNAQGNSARLLAAVPRVYGRMHTYPDLASQPYSEFMDNEQYLYQLFCVSEGPVDIEAMLYDGNNINNFEDAKYEIIKPFGVVTLFPDNVVTSESVQQLNMLGPNNPDYHVLGPFVSAPAGTKSNFIAIDVAFPRGGATIDDKGNRNPIEIIYHFEYRSIDDTGAAIGPWKTLVHSSRVLATEKAQVFSHKPPVELGRYEVQGYRVSSEPADTRTYGDIQWVGLRAYLENTHVYGNCTLIATAMRATNALNSSTARKFSVISKGLIPVWDKVNGWSDPKFTTNPAWIAADIVRDKDYGRGLETSRLNINKLHALSLTWAERGDEFNGVFDTTVQLWDALSKVCRVGRAVPISYAGVIDVIRDEPKTIPTAQFQASNMAMGSFSTTYNFFAPNTPDHVVMEYIDPITWKPATVPCFTRDQ